MNISDVKPFLIKWGPRAIAAGLGGYYCLGIAYEIGIMAAIDKIAIQILKQSVGYAGVGALMPTVQWYSAMAVRVVFAFACGLAYDLIEKIGCCVYQKCFKGGSSSQVQPNGQTLRPLSSPA